MCGLTTLLALQGAGEPAAADTTVPYLFDGLALYQYGVPSDLVTGAPIGNPETGYVTITNHGTSSFAGTAGFNAVDCSGVNHSSAYPVTLIPGAHVSVSIDSESSNDGGFNGPCFNQTNPVQQNGGQFEIKGTITLGPNSQMVDLSIYDKDIHSGLPSTNPFGVTLDNFILQGGDAYGRDAADSYEVSQTPGVFQLPAASSSPDLIAGVVQVAGTPATGAHVQACKISGGNCVLTPYATSPGGGFAMHVISGTYSVSALLPPSYAIPTPQTVGPVTVPPSVTNVVVNFTQNPLPAGTTFNGYGPGQVPTVFWGSPSTLTMPGCAGGYGVVYVHSTNTTTAQAETLAFPMIESSLGSGTYVANLPALAPLHGNASLEPQIGCPGTSHLLPDGGDPSGGTPILISGSGFSGATAVTFGTAPATTFQVISDNVVSAISPAGVGQVAVTVTTPSGVQTLGNYVYFAISNITTSAGPAAGGTSVTVLGSGFTNVRSVIFGLMSALSFTVLSSTQIQVVAPPGVGTVVVQVLNGFASSAPTSNALFSYQNGPPGTSSITEPTTPDGPMVLADAISGACSQTNLQTWDQTFGGPSGEQLCSVPRNFLDFFGQGQVVSSFLVGGIFVILGLALGVTALPALVVLATVGVFVGAALYTFAGLRFCGTNCPPGSFLGFYIDPSGNVVDTSGNPINGANVTLLSRGPGGFVPADPLSGSINPATNPETTGIDGAFEWEAFAGTYEVQANAPNCHAPGNSAQANVTTSSFIIPPPAVGLLLALECPGSIPPAPTITAVSPNLGPSTGSNRVEIMGTGLAEASAVHFGSASAIAITPISPFAVAAIAPAGTSTQDVTVTTPAGTSAVSTGDQYTYLPILSSPQAPTVSAVLPGAGPIWGGTAVAIRGTNLDGVFAVSFGGVPATALTDVSSTEVDAITPFSLSIGPVDVSVSGLHGTSAINRSDGFLYVDIRGRTSAQSSSTVPPQRGSVNPSAAGSPGPRTPRSVRPRQTGAKTPVAPAADRSDKAASAGASRDQSSKSVAGSTDGPPSGFRDGVNALIRDIVILLSLGTATA
jgi:hypothetical protein